MSSASQLPISITKNQYEICQSHVMYSSVIMEISLHCTEHTLFLRMRGMMELIWLDIATTWAATHHDNVFIQAFVHSFFFKQLCALPLSASVTTCTPGLENTKQSHAFHAPTLQSHALFSCYDHENRDWHFYFIRDLIGISNNLAIQCKPAV